MTSEFWWVIPLVGFISACLGAGTAFFGLIWRYRADFRGAIVQNLCTDIQAASDLASEYWLIDLSGSPEAGESYKAANLSARLWGYAEKIDHGVEIARPHLYAVDMLGMDIPLGELMDGLTGGEFRDPGREADVERSINVQSSAAKVIRDFRLASNRRALS